MLAKVLITPDRAKEKVDTISYQIGTSFSSSSRWVKLSSVIKYPELGKNKNHINNPIKNKTKAMALIKIMLKFALTQNNIKVTVKLINKITNGKRDNLKFFNIGLKILTLNSIGRNLIVIYANAFNKIVAKSNVLNLKLIPHLSFSILLAGY
jgi:hypothetical protein